jgi:hypothetical protein
MVEQSPFRPDTKRLIYNRQAPGRRAAHVVMRELCYS